jgi:pantetheine-phosphate adenylyltransferase
MHKVIYPGSFDPPTNGHLNIIQRASKMFDQVEIVISSNPKKKSLFTAKERYDMIQAMVGDLKNVHVHTWPGLVVDFARKSGIRTILRGVRALVDFEYEFELYMMNHALNPDIETIFIPTDQKYFVLRSSGIKEVALFGGDVSEMVPPIVEKALKEKLADAESPLD